MTEFGHPAIFVPDVGLGSYDALKGALKWTLEREKRRRLQRPGRNIRGRSLVRAGCRKAASQGSGEGPNPQADRPSGDHQVRERGSRPSALEAELDSGINREHKRILCPIGQ